MMLLNPGALVRGAAITLLAIGMSGCVVRTTRRPGVNANVRVRARTPPPPRATVTVQTNSGGSATAVAPAPTLATGVTIVEATCSQGAQEVCNGLDDNCNGQIDEGCGYSSGNIQITLAWNGGADLDMYVRDPNNETISYSSRRSQSGGHLDQDARGACNANQANNTIENVYWDQQDPPNGAYNVQVHYWAGSACSTSAGPTNMTLSISVGGQILGAYNYVINPDDRIDIASFQI